MNILAGLKRKHIGQLQSELALVGQAPASSGIAGLLTLQSTIGTFDEKINQIVSDVNRRFVDEINDSVFETSFSDEARMQCYEEFRKECSEVVSGFTKSMFSPTKK